MLETWMLSICKSANNLLMIFKVESGKPSSASYRNKYQKKAIQAVAKRLWIPALATACTTFQGSVYLEWLASQPERLRWVIEYHWSFVMSIVGSKSRGEQQEIRLLVLRKAKAAMEYLSFKFLFCSSAALVANKSNPLLYSTLYNGLSLSLSLWKFVSLIYQSIHCSIHFSRTCMSKYVMYLSLKSFPCIGVPKMNGVPKLSRSATTQTLSLSYHWQWVDGVKNIMRRLNSWTGLPCWRHHEGTTLLNALTSSLPWKAHLKLVW